MKGIIAAFAGLFLSAAAATAAELAPTGTLRAAFIATNPAQARIDPATGEAIGPAADLARALAQELKVQVAITPAPGVAGVIEAVVRGSADIGFVAYDASRAEQVAFSQPYLLAHNTYIVRANAPFAAAADVDRPGIRIGVGERDAADLYLTRVLRSAELRRRPSTELADGIKKLVAGELDAYAANRTRLLEIAAREPSLRLLPDNFYDVEQAIAVSKANAGALGSINRFLEQARATGRIQAAVERAGLKGVSVAPVRP
jgi:polar amino acid transport system substrate-binding protein